MLAHEREIRAGLDPYYGGQWIPRLERAHAELAPDASFESRMSIDTRLSDWYLREGRVEDSLRILEQLLLGAKSAPDATIGHVVGILRTLAIANFRLAEQQNCICEQNGESCVFPLRGRAEHADRTGATAAVGYLEKVLELSPEDLHSVWLLNLAHMALGSYPDGVPPLFLIQPERLESDGALGRFEDAAPRLGLNRRSCAGGAVMDDFDGDGDLDVITSSMDLGTPMAYHRNLGDRFEDVTSGSGLESQLGALNFAHGDVDGDGRLDLYVPRGAWMNRQGEVPHSLLRQQEDGTFLDVSKRSGLELAIPSQVAVFGDVDNDGDLDLFVGGESVRTRTSWLYPSRLYLNNGRGRFTDVTVDAGVANLGYCKGAAFADYDADGHLDLYVSNQTGPNRLYHNRGDGSFEDVAVAMGVAEPLASFCTWWFDVDNDGWQDLFVTSYSGRDRVSEVSAYYKHGTTGMDSARIYRNEEGQGFRDVSEDMGLHRPMFPMGANFGDFDGDGYPDLYLGTGDPSFGSLWPNVALRNDRGRSLQDVTTTAGLGHLQKGHGISFGDIDHDGDQDMLVQLGGAYRDDAFYDALYLNPGHGQRWLTVRPEGRISNRFAIGARLRVRIEEESEEGSPGEPVVRDVYHWVGGTGSFGGNSLQAEIGLGRAQRILEMEVRWPATGMTQVFDAVPLDRVVRLIEGEDELETLELSVLEL